MKKRAILYSLCATAMAMSGLVLGAAPASASIHNTPGYVHIVNAGSGKCLDASDQGAVQWRCLNTFNEEWQFIYFFGGNAFYIVNHASGKCLTVAGSGQDFPNGTPVVLAPCPGSGEVVLEQIWGVGDPQFGPLALGTFNVVNNSEVFSIHCLDLENGDTSDGVPLQVWDCNFNTNNQRWHRL